jgi:hypothetical protein
MVPIVFTFKRCQKCGKIVFDERDEKWLLPLVMGGAITAVFGAFGLVWALWKVFLELME